MKREDCENCGGVGHCHICDARELQDSREVKYDPEITSEVLNGKTIERVAALRGMVTFFFTDGTLATISADEAYDMSVMTMVKGQIVRIRDRN